MTTGSYQQFCPVAMAAEILCTRWTIVLLREMFAGSTRFNELRRGVPRMSPALLSQRLKELEAAGIVARAASGADPAVSEYRLTESGRDLGPLVEAFGVWGQRRIESKLSLQHLDVDLLMWDMRRNLNTTPMPARRSVVEIVYPELPAAQRRWWLIVDPGTGVDLCKIDPGLDVDLYVSADLRSMTAIWLGLDTVRAAVANRRMVLTGSRQLASSMQTWLGTESLCQGAQTRELAIGRRHGAKQRRSTVRELDRDCDLPIIGRTDDPAREKNHELHRKLFLRRSQNRSHGVAGGHGLLPLQFLPFMVGIAGQRLQSLEVGCGKDHGGSRSTSRRFRRRRSVSANIASCVAAI